MTNIAVCYNYYSTVIFQSYTKNSKNVKDSVLSIPDKIAKLIGYIQKMIVNLRINLLDPTKPTDIRNLFVGFDILNRGSTNNKLIPNIIQDKHFKEYCLLGIMPNEFKTFMQMYCFEKKIYFGGIPVTLSSETFNKNIPICYKFFLQYRFLSNKNLIELLEVFKKQNQQKPTKQEYDELVLRVKRDFDNILYSVERMPNSIEKYRIIILKTIEFGIKEFTKTLKSIQLRLSRKEVTKSTSRLSKTNSNPVRSNNSNSNNIRKIGEFKQTIYNFLYNLKDAKLDQNLYLFLYGQLFQFIYRVDEVMNYNRIMTPDEFKANFESLGIEIEMSDREIQEKAKQITLILTDPDKSLKLKSRFFGLFSPKQVLSNNAKKILTTSFDSEALKPHWWVDIEKQYLKFSGNRRLFVIAIEPVMLNLGKLSKLNVWLIDVFATAQSQMKPITRNYVKTFEQVGSNGVVQKEYYGDNQMIMLNPYFRIMREFKGELQKFVTKDPTWWKNIQGKKKTFFRNLFQSKNKAARLQKGEFGRLLSEYLGIRKKDKNAEEGFKNSEILTRLIQGKLDSYVENRNESNKLKFSLLMGYDHAQLSGILRNQLESMSKGQRITNKAKSYDDWQLYLIENKDYSSIEGFRMWAFNLLMSKPWFFNKNTIEGKYNIVPMSNFSKMQVPFKNYFIKVGDFGISSVLLDFFKIITEDLFKNSRNLKLIEVNKNFIPQVDLSELEIPRNRKNITLAEGINRKFVNNVAKNNSSSISALSSSAPQTSSQLSPELKAILPSLSSLSSLQQQPLSQQQQLSQRNYQSQQYLKAHNYLNLARSHSSQSQYYPGSR